jgi:hypothetical protein
MPNSNRQWRDYLENWLQVSSMNKRPEINQGIRQMFEPKIMRFLGLETGQNPAEFVFPSKRAFNCKPQGVDHLIPEAGTTAFRHVLVSVAGILFDIGDQPAIENLLAIGATIKAGIQIDGDPRQLNSHRPDDPPHLVQGVREQGNIRGIRRFNLHRAKDIPVVVNDAQCLTAGVLFMSCVCHRLPTFFRDGIRPIPMQHRQIKLTVLMQATNTLDKGGLQRPLSHPASKPAKDRRIVNPLNREHLPLTAGIQHRHDGVEYPDQRDFSFRPPFGKRQERQEKFLKLRLRHFRRNRVPINVFGSFFVWFILSSSLISSFANTLFSHKITRQGKTCNQFIRKYSKLEQSHWLDVLPAKNVSN